MQTVHQTVQDTDTTIAADFPADLFQEIQRIARQENWPMSRALILLTRLGVKSQKESEARLASIHQSFLDETDLKAKDRLGDEMLRSIFGPGSVA